MDHIKEGLIFFYWPFPVCICVFVIEKKSFLAIQRFLRISTKYFFLSLEKITYLFTVLISNTLP